MNKIFKKILLVGFISLLFPMVSAETFKSKDTTYVLEKVNFACDLFDGDEEIINIDIIIILYIVILIIFIKLMRINVLL